MKILLVEDNKVLAEEIKEFLIENEFLVETSSALADATSKIELYEYDVILLDLGLPDGNGLDLIPIIKKKSSDTGIIILTAKHAIDEKVKGLNMGADDYITKPFHKAELNARIHSLTRRNKTNGANSLVINEMEIDTYARVVKVNEQELNLTRKEYDLLIYFIYNKNRLLTKENIAEHLWGDHIDQSDNFDFIYNHIKNLRNKISKANGSNYIHSMYGLGYKFFVS